MAGAKRRGTGKYFHPTLLKPEQVFVALSVTEECLRHKFNGGWGEEFDHLKSAYFIRTYLKK